MTSTPDTDASTVATDDETTDALGDLIVDEQAHPVLGRVFQAVLFDMDGTLIDSTLAVNRAWGQWANEIGMGSLFAGVEHGRPAHEMVAALVPEELVESSIARVLELELADTTGIVIKDGAAEMMAAIPEERRAIVTSATRDLCLTRLAAAGFDAPATVVTIEDSLKGKPAPDPFLDAADRLGVDPRQCLVVEDAPAGLTAGRGAGCATIGVVGTHAADDLDADLVVTSLDRLRIELHDHGVVVTLLPIKD